MRLWVLTFDEPRFEEESPQLFSWGDARHATDEEVIIYVASLITQERLLDDPVVARFVDRIQSWKGDRAYLGLATTRELLNELSARIEVHGPGLDYRTVEGD